MSKPSEKGRSPSMQFYFRQFTGDEHVKAMDLDTVGAHILLMCYAGASPERYRLHNKPDFLRRLLKLNLSDFERIFAQLLEGAWKVSPCGLWIEQHGMYATLKKQKEFSKLRADAANARWGNAKGMQNGCKTDANAMPSSASTSASTSTNKEKIIQGSNSIGAAEQPENHTPTCSIYSNPFLEMAEGKLEVPNGQEWVNSSLHANTGKRPMKDYPELWLTPHELADVIKNYDEAKIPGAKWRTAFYKAQSALKQPDGGTKKMANVYNWLIGWIKKEIMDDVRSEAYMQKALEVKHGAVS